MWHRWVLNEGGDYIGFRDSITKPHDFDELFGKDNWIPRCRKFLSSANYCAVILTNKSKPVLIMPIYNPA